MLCGGGGAGKSMKRAPASVARRLAAVSAWYRVLAAEELVAVMPTVDTDRPVVNVDDAAILGMDRGAAAQLSRTAHTDGVRSYALVALLLLRELRIAEALALDAEDVATTVRGHRVATITGKGGRTRFAALPPAVTPAVGTLLDGQTEGPLFVTRTGARWQPSGAYRVVRRLARDAGIPGFARVHPHALRHTAVTRALDSGANLVDVQDMAGHRDPRTTSNNAWRSELHPGRHSAALLHRLFTVGARGAWHGFRMVTDRGRWRVGR